MKIPDISEIIVSWHRARKPTPEQEHVANQRANICDTCDEREFMPIIKMWKCGACGCPITKKIYTPKGPGACPRDKWPI